MLTIEEKKTTLLFTVSDYLSSLHWRLKSEAKALSFWQYPLMWQTSPSLDWLAGWLASAKVTSHNYHTSHTHIYNVPFYRLFQQNETGERTTIIKTFFFSKIFLNNLQVVFHSAISDVTKGFIIATCFTSPLSTSCCCFAIEFVLSWFTGF